MKNILFVTYDFPFPATSGGKVRAYNLIKHGLKSHNVFLISFTREEIDKSRVNELNSIGVREVKLIPRRKVLDIRNFSLFSNDSIFKKLYYSKNTDELICSWIVEKQIDSLICESYYTSFYLWNMVKDLNVKKIFGTENIEHKIYGEYVAGSKVKLFNNLFTREVEKIKREEIKAMRFADIVLAANKQEKKEIESFTHKKTVLIENGVDLNKFPYSWKRRDTRNILFVGNFSYFPNREGIERFYKEVFVKLEDKGIHLKIIGAHVHRLRIRDDRVKCVEYVQDIHKEYANADIFVFPVKIGGGTNFKVLEAMAVGVPIVAHPERMKVIDAKNGTHFLGSQSPQEVLEGIEKIFIDKDFATKLSKNSRRLIEDDFSWEVIGKKLNEVI